MMRLERLARGANEIAQDSDVRTVSADAAGVDGKAEALGDIEIDSGVIEFRKAETLRGQNTIDARRIDGTRRAVTLPGAPRQFVELLPIAFVPRGHGNLCYVLFSRLDARNCQKVRI